MNEAVTSCCDAFNNVYQIRMVFPLIEKCGDKRIWPNYFDLFEKNTKKCFSRFFECAKVVDFDQELGFTMVSKFFSSSITDIATYRLNQPRGQII